MQSGAACGIQTSKHKKISTKMGHGGAIKHHKGPSATTSHRKAK